MNLIEMKEKLYNILSNNGVEYTENDNEEIMLDSIDFVSIIVEIENEFDIVISEEFIQIDKLRTVNQFIVMIAFELGMRDLISDAIKEN